MMVCAEDDPRRSGTIWLLDLDKPFAIVKPLVPAIFRRVKAQSAPYLDLGIDGESSHDVLGRFETGRRCCIARVDGKLAAYGWVSFDEEFIGELGLRLKLSPGEAYIWDCYTAPSFRNRHLFSALLSYIASELKAEGLCRVWIGANLENLASQRGIARAGFQPVADLAVARVLALRQVWVLGKPGVPESLVAEARRVFLDNRAGVWLSALSAVSR